MSTNIETPLSLEPSVAEADQIEAEFLQKIDEMDKHVAHIVTPAENVHIWQIGMSTQEMVDWAILKGVELTALCGYKWVPKRDPDKLDVCETCMAIAQFRMKMHGE